MRAMVLSESGESFGIADLHRRPSVGDILANSRMWKIVSITDKTDFADQGSEIEIVVKSAKLSYIDDFDEGE